MNRLLKRQLRRELGINSPEELDAFLEELVLFSNHNELTPNVKTLLSNFSNIINRIDQSYDQHVRDQELRDRSLRLSSEELTEANELLRAQKEQLENIAHYDSLTGLPNRRLLADRLQQSMAQSLRREKLLGIVYLDLDGFKAVNDTHGHDMGDKLLVTVANRMKHALREVDTLSRLGGDEFVAVLGDLDDIDSATHLLERLLEAASLPIYINDLKMEVSASLGVTFYPLEDLDADQLLRQADQAMYRAKNKGKNRYEIFAHE